MRGFEGCIALDAVTFANFCYLLLHIKIREHYLSQNYEKQTPCRTILVRFSLSNGATVLLVI